ncbi:MAG TPA: prealbumin-like fold domain-containing protein [Acidimicrobiales bacterium]|nr:prealbumin-like fold domain-containing protein [Acidimicrobiales bacterium]
MSVVRALRFAAFVLLVSLPCIAGPIPRSHAEVVPAHGFRATVDGFTSWFGAYDMADLGTAWCIDHGIAAPDAALDYRPTEPPLSGTTRTAIAWLAGRNGFDTDAVDAAAMMLALHDLMGATYPSGRLDVDRLTAPRLVGFGGAEAAVLERARELKADAIAHSSVVGPLILGLDTDAGAPGTPGTLRARVTDSNGAGVSGILVWTTSQTAHLETAVVETGPDGVALIGFVAPDAPAVLDVLAIAPSLDPAIYAPTKQRAQRVVAPRQQILEGQIETQPPPPGRLRLEKVDQGSGQRLAGALIEVHSAEPRADGASLVATVETTTEPTMLDLGQGTYWLVERGAPPGYALSTEATSVEVRSGETVRIIVPNELIPAPPTTTVATTTVSTTGESIPAALPTVPTQQVAAPVALPRTGAMTVPTTLIGGGLVFLGIALTIGVDVDPDGRLRPIRRSRRPSRWRSRRGRARSSGGASRTRRSRRPPSAGRR